MSTTPKPPSQLLRSLGADESLLDAKLKASAREAEQRWPLFRALTPSPSELPPALSDDDKRAWDRPEPANTPKRKPLLTRPGLSSKLASSLEKFTKTKIITPQSRRNINPETTNSASAKATPSGYAARAQSRSDQPVSQEAEVSQTISAPLFPPIPQTRPASTLFPNKLAPESTAAPVPQTRPLFGAQKAKSAPPATSTKKNVAVNTSPFSMARPTPTEAVATSRADGSLAALFGRVEGKQAGQNPKDTPKAPSSVMRRIGKR